MKTNKAMVKSDVIVLFGCLLLLLTTLGAVGPSGRRRAKESVCLENLRRWGLVFDNFVRDNGGYFLSVEDAGPYLSLWWIGPLQKYYKDSRLLLCPETTASSISGYYSSRTAWQAEQYVGSYGINGWTCNAGPGGVWGHGVVAHYWKTPNVQTGDTVPVFSDMLRMNAWPLETDTPPMYDGAQTYSYNQMSRVCTNRHNGAVACLFMDWSARKVGLKELWTLKWHRTFYTDGPWTKAGGVLPSDWPGWMREFKEF